MLMTPSNVSLPRLATPFQSICLLGCLLAAMIHPLQGQVASGEIVSETPLSLHECIKTVLLKNRALQIERINPLIAQATLSASFGYYDPILFSQADRENATDTGGFDPADFSRDAIYEARSDVVRSGLTGFLPSGMSYNLTADYAHSQGTRNFLNFESYKATANLSVRQPLLKNFWIDQARMVIRINRKNLQITELGVRYLTMDVINQVQQAYYELTFTRENLSIQQRLLQTKNDLLRGIRDQVQAGTMTVLEEKQAVSQAARVDADLITASNQVVLAENVLKSLMAYDATQWNQKKLIPTERLLALPENLDLMESWKKGVVQRPDYVQLKHDLEKSDIDLKYRRNQLFPSLDLIAGYGRRGASAVQTLPPFTARASASEAFNQLPDGDAPSDMIGLIFSLPLSRKAERANFRASRHLREQAQLRIKEKEELILREIADALNTVQSAWERVKATQRAREASRIALEAEEQKLQGGKSSVFFVLQLQTDLAATETSEIRSKADYSKNLSQLYFCEGSLLDRSRFQLDLE